MGLAPLEGEGWRRYLALMLDSLTPVGAPRPLPPATPLLAGWVSDRTG